MDACLQRLEYQENRGDRVVVVVWNRDGSFGLVWIARAIPRGPVSQQSVTDTTPMSYESFSLCLVEPTGKPFVSERSQLPTPPRLARTA